MGRRPLRVVLIALAAAAAAAVLLLVAMALVGNHHANSARTAADDVRSAVDAGDAAAATVALAQVAEHSAGVGRWLGGPPWVWLTWLPVIGDGIAATAEIAAGLDAVVVPMAAGAVDVFEASAEGTDEAVTALHEQAEVFVAAGREAVEREPVIAAIDASALPGPFADLVAEAQQEFPLVADLATGAAAGAVLLPGLLGLDGDVPWLLVASQPAESRGSGAGFFGAVGAMEGIDGVARLTAVHPNDEFYDVPAELDQLPAEFAQLWGESAAFVWAHNLTRHFPYAAPLLRDSSASVTEPARYIVAADPSVVAALLTITGPVTAAGVTIDAETAEQYLTRDIYADFPAGAEKDEAASQLLAAAFSAFQAADYTPSELATALAAPIAEQRLLAWAAEAEQQEVLAWTPLAGSVPEPEWTLTAAINNAAGNKLDAYLATEIALTADGRCTALTSGEVAVRLALDAIPAGLPDYVVGGVRGPDEYGGTRVVVHVYGPPGAQLTALTIDDVPAVPQQGTELGRPVWGVAVDLIPQRPRTVSVAFDGQWDSQPIDFFAQPMVQPTSVEVLDARSCTPGS